MKAAMLIALAALIGWALWAMRADRWRPDAASVGAQGVALGTANQLLTADALKAAGVEVESHLALGQMHVFFQMYNVLPGYADGIERVSDWINRHI